MREIARQSLEGDSLTSQPVAVVSITDLAQWQKRNGDKGVVDFVYFDDAAYSGAQTAHMVSDFGSAQQESGNTGILHLAIPFTSKRAIALIKESAELVDVKAKVQWASYDQRIKTIEEIFDPIFAVLNPQVVEHYKEILRSNFIGRDPLAYTLTTLTYFDHAAPDFRSFPTYVMSGWVIGDDQVIANNGEPIQFIPSIQKPYRKPTLSEKAVEMSSIGIADAEPAINLGYIVKDHETLELDSKVFGVKNKASIGRFTNNTIVLTDSDVSRNHAEIYYSGSSWVVEDLNSTNGVYVNKSSIFNENGKLDSEDTQAKTLSNGDRIWLSSKGAGFIVRIPSRSQVGFGSIFLTTMNPNSQPAEKVKPIPVEAQLTLEEATQKANEIKNALRAKTISEDRITKELKRLEEDYKSKSAKIDPLRKQYADHLVKKMIFGFK